MTATLQMLRQNPQDALGSVAVGIVSIRIFGWAGGGRG